MPNELFRVFPDLNAFPTTRYQGSKRRLLPALYATFTELSFGTALDLFSGSGSVALLLRSLGKNVVANDFLPFNAATAHLLLSLQSSDLPSHTTAEADLKRLLDEAPLTGPALVSANFQGKYFTDPENLQIDRFCQNITTVADPLHRQTYLYALGQGLLMKRPFSLFHRANLSVRTNPVERSFGNAATWNAPIIAHAVNAIDELARFDWPEITGHSLCYSTATDLALLPKADLIYVDPPYIAASGSVVDYADFYHFLTGLIDYAAFAQGNRQRKHNPITNQPSRWRHETSALAEIDEILRQWPASIIVFSYRTDGQPTIQRLTEALSQHDRVCDVKSITFQYALSRKKTHEVIIISNPSTFYIE